MKKALWCTLLMMVSGFIWAAGGGPGMTAEEAEAKLKEGNNRFVQGIPQYPHQDFLRRSETALYGQNPFVTVISCSDSRVPVELAFDQGIGDIFVIRVAGNVVDTDEAGSIEYGVEHLQTPLFVVLGHKQCGACTAVVNNAELHGNIPPLVDNIIPARDKTIAQNPGLTGTDLVDAVIKENVWQSIEDLYSISPISANRVRTGKLKVVGALYNLETGAVEWMGSHPLEAELLGTGINAYSADAVYNKGDLCTYNGNTWEAQWWTQGEAPSDIENGVWKLIK